jgi:gamma-glutamyl-gamma-aminobutyrate hydrolase PuuD
VRTLSRVVVGITDRGDIPRQIDQAVVAFGTGCEVIVVERASDIFRVDALFIPGGMFDLPGTRGEALSAHEPRTETQRTDWVRRVQLQRDIVAAAQLRNVPVLGVCGGSRAIAQTVRGGYTQHLSGSERTTHNLDFSYPWNVAHNVTISGDTMLGRIAAGGHYRRSTARVADTTTPVNSMHWASSGFDDPRIVEIAAAAPDSVLEGWALRGHPFFVGVQWHPEFAQLPLGEFEEASDVHSNIMGALGDAAEENRAARIIQHHIRQFLRRRSRWAPSHDAPDPRYAEDAAPDWADVPVDPSRIGSFDAKGNFQPPT